jgi:nucleotidyltransferase/DNA polymerase involved in DNA repair
MAERTYLCIDLKSFYASVECIERGLDPMATNLVVSSQVKCTDFRHKVHSDHVIDLRCSRR